MTTKFANNNGVKIAYETIGDPKNETIIFICGLGSQLVYYSNPLCQKFVDRGFHVIRFDSRDTGLSDKTDGTPPDVESLMSEGSVVSAPYTLSHMAADTIAVLDAVGVEKAHIAGNSLGGMIAQTVAIEFPDRCHSLTSIMSAASRSAAVPEDGERDEAVEASLTVDLSDPNTYVDLQVEGYRVTSGHHFDPVYMRDIIQRSFDRSYHPDGWSYQMMAAIASGDRTEKLKRVNMPALIIHGGADSLIPVASGIATASAIPNARCIVIEEMGHNLPEFYWAFIAEQIAMMKVG